MRGMRLVLQLTFRGFAQVGGYINLLCNITFGRGLSANFAKPLLGEAGICWNLPGNRHPFLVAQKVAF